MISFVKIMTLLKITGKMANKLTIKQLAELFFEKRFGEDKLEFDKKTGYLQEWIDRFEGKEPESFMDKESKRVYWKLLDELREKSPLQKPFSLTEKNTDLTQII